MITCPHCETLYQDYFSYYLLENGIGGNFMVASTQCLACREVTIFLAKPSDVELENLKPGMRRLTDIPFEFQKFDDSQISSAWVAYPKVKRYKPCPPEVNDDDLRLLYEQSNEVLQTSPMASAALSRRCLQQVLRGKAGVKKSNLNREIQEVLDSKALPGHLADNLDYIRRLGNYAAHPEYSDAGVLVDVEPDEAQWSIEILQHLFEFYYVLPKRSEQMKARLEAKSKPPTAPPETS